MAQSISESLRTSSASNFSRLLGSFALVTRSQGPWRLPRDSPSTGLDSDATLSKYGKTSSSAILFHVSPTTMSPASVELLWSFPRHDVVLFHDTTSGESRFLRTTSALAGESRLLRTTPALPGEARRSERLQPLSARHAVANASSPFRRRGTQ